MCCSQGPRWKIRISTCSRTTWNDSRTTSRSIGGYWKISKSSREWSWSMALLGSEWVGDPAVSQHLVEHCLRFAILALLNNMNRFPNRNPVRILNRNLNPNPSLNQNPNRSLNLSQNRNPNRSRNLQVRCWDPTPKDDLLRWTVPLQPNRKRM